MLSDQTPLETYGAVPSQVIVTAISTPLPADGTTHPALELSLEDAQGSPAIAASDIPVGLSTSQDQIVSVTDAVIPAGQTFAVVNVTAGILQGTANVTALVSSFTSGYASSSVDLSTVIPAPSAISAYAPNGNVIVFSPTTSRQLPLMAVQLLDATGNPARARAPMNITVTSSNSTVISKVFTALIGVGQDYASIPLEAKAPGVTTLTLSTPGLSTASLIVNFLAYPGQETLTGGPASIFMNETAVVSVNVALDGSPVAGTVVDWKASSGGLVIVTQKPTNSSIATAASTSSDASESTRSTIAPQPTGVPAANVTTDSRGISEAIFHPAHAGSVLITAVVAPGALLTKTLNFTILVSAPPVSTKTEKAKGSVVQDLTTFPLLLAPVGGAGGAVAAVFLVKKRRGGKADGDQEFDTSFE